MQCFLNLLRDTEASRRRKLGHDANFRLFQPGSPARDANQQVISYELSRAVGPVGAPRGVDTPGFSRVLLGSSCAVSDFFSVSFLWLVSTWQQWTLALPCRPLPGCRAA